MYLWSFSYLITKKWCNLKCCCLYWIGRAAQWETWVCDAYVWFTMWTLRMVLTASCELCVLCSCPDFQNKLNFVSKLKIGSILKLQFGFVSCNTQPYEKHSYSSWSTLLLQKWFFFSFGSPYNTDCSSALKNCSIKKPQTTTHTHCPWHHLLSIMSK